MEFMSQTTLHSETGNLILFGKSLGNTISCQITIDAIEDYHPEDKSDWKTKFDKYRNVFEEIAAKKIVTGNRNPIITSEDLIN